MRCVFFDPDGPRVLDHLDTVDISRSGVGAISNHRYYPGQRVVVVMPQGEEQPLRSRYATVTRCLTDQEGGYKVGLRFDAASVSTTTDFTDMVRAAA